MFTSRCVVQVIAFAGGEAHSSLDSHTQAVCVSLDLLVLCFIFQC